MKIIKGLKRTLAAAALIACMIMLSGCVIHTGGGLSTIKYDNADSYSIGSGSTSDNIRNLEIDWISGKVDISYGKGDEIVFEETSKDEITDELTMRWLVEDGTLHIKFCKAGKINVNNCDKTLKLTLPKKLELQEAEFETVSADIKASELNVKDVNFETVSGSVEASLYGVRSIDADSVSGDIDIIAPEGPENADIETNSGSVLLNLKKSAGDCEISTVSGKVTLLLPKKGNFTISYDTTSGDFDSDIEMTPKGSKYVAGKGSDRFTVDTTSGDLRIKKA